jgi:hypothetical protein
MPTFTCGCPCGHELEVPHTAVGTELACPHCGAVRTIPPPRPGQVADNPGTAGFFALVIWVIGLAYVWKGDSCTVAGAAFLVGVTGGFAAWKLAAAARFSVPSRLVLAVVIYFASIAVAAGEERGLFRHFSAPWSSRMPGR